MTATRRTLTRTDLAPLARAALGPGWALTGVERLRGGTKKGVYRLALDDGSTAIAYVWSADEDFWDAGPSDPRDPFSHGTGLGLFTAAHDRLVAVGVRTPRLLYADATHRHLPADAAVVEDMSGGSLEDALAREPDQAPRAMERMAELLVTLHARTGPRLGKVALVDNGGSSRPASCEQRVTEGALRCIAEAARREPRVAAVRRELEETVLALAAEVRPRDRHTLIHGELGPDHVLLTPDGQPALIDIEGLMYFDLEHEHVFLRLRFGPHYDALRVPGLDEARLRLYRLAMHIGLVSGPLTLIEGDFPHPERMREIAEHNLRETLSLLRSAS
ncbi:MULTISPECIES: phosphotransferase family protein [Streptomyces]|uniref:Phosphotransferase n=1 Tax=Streptomyces koelreuteriae TaxID=2838015 RepID=A0ABX8FQ97_9ACTN|nr:MULTISPECIES: phosphotransferase [Streptomyces]QWB23279.1 phosphotransferase [Streptomyces koelreuteriae]UUA06231.1 aminoglycoside phosphotransferase family protein [Streptomyces koelreuteriae]UUA13858.1 aminoglycoside phosphotransferase family protein [Streptomyces sp. CRCS-T-1]